VLDYREDDSDEMVAFGLPTAYAAEEMLNEFRESRGAIRWLMETVAAWSLDETKDAEWWGRRYDTQTLQHIIRDVRLGGNRRRQ
jgi:hypothetical protein